MRPVRHYSTWQVSFRPLREVLFQRYVTDEVMAFPMAGGGERSVMTYNYYNIKQQHLHASLFLHTWPSKLLLVPVVVSREGHTLQTISHSSRGPTCSWSTSHSHLPAGTQGTPYTSLLSFSVEIETLPLAEAGSASWEPWGVLYDVHLPPFSPILLAYPYLSPSL